MAENSPEKRQAQNARMIKAKTNGFATGKHLAKEKIDTTEMIEEIGAPHLPRIIEKMWATWEDGLDSSNLKIRIDTAHKLMGHTYKPTQNVKIEGTQTNVNLNITNLDGMSQEGLDLLSRAQNAMTPKDEDIEGTAVEE